MVKYLLVLFMFFATSVFAGGAGGSWGEPTQPTKPAPTNDTGDYTGGGGKFGGGGAGGSWETCKYTASVYRQNFEGQSYDQVCQSIPHELIVNPSYYPNYNYKSFSHRKLRFSSSYKNIAYCDFIYNHIFGGLQIHTSSTIKTDCENHVICQSGQTYDEQTKQCKTDDEPPPNEDKDKDKDKDKECDATCKCKAELEAIRKAILSLKLDVDLSSLERKLDALISAIRNQKSVEVDLSNIESQLSAIHFAILASKYDDRQLQAKIDALTKQVTQTNAKLDTIIDTLNRPQQCSTNPFNKKICDFIDWFQGSIPPLDDNSAVSVDDGSRFDWQSIAQNNYLTLPSSCPFNPLFNVPFLGKAASIVFPMDIVCRGAVMLKVLILLWASFTSLRIIGDTPL